MLEITIVDNQKVVAKHFYDIIAGVDDTRTPRLVKVDEDGRLDLGGVIIPKWDTVTPTYYGSTNNMHTAVYSLEGNEVARWTLTYVGGGAANNDRLATAVFSKPPP